MMMCERKLLHINTMLYRTQIQLKASVVIIIVWNEPAFFLESLSNELGEVGACAQEGYDHQSEPQNPEVVVLRRYRFYGPRVTEYRHSRFLEPVQASCWMPEDRRYSQNRSHSGSHFR